MHSFRITDTRTIKLELGDLLWVVKHRWIEVGTDFNTTDDYPVSLVGKIFERKGYPIGDFEFINGDTDDFRSSNLVPRDPCYNPNHKGYSPYRGVTYHFSKGKWVAQLTFQGNRVLYKKFNSELEAALAYNNVCKQLGLTDRLNKIG